jgi:hypothetical protein
MLHPGWCIARNRDAVRRPLRRLESANLVVLIDKFVWVGAHGGELVEENEVIPVA